MNFNLPANALASTTEIMTSLFTGFSPLFYLILGVVLIGALISIIISAIRG